MKIELIRKVMVVGISLLIGIAICVSVWFFLRDDKARELQGQSRPTGFNNEIAADNQTTLQSFQKSAENLNEEPLSTLGTKTKKERVTRQASSMFMSSLSEEQLATPFAQKMLEAMNSPEYLDRLKPGFTEREWNDFMESQGVPVIRGYSGLFRKFVSNVELADYEPVVRLKLAEFFIAAEPVDLTDPVAAAHQRSRVYLELGKELTETDLAAAAWFIEKFGEDRDGAFRWQGVENNTAFIWMTDIQQNAASIVAAAETAEGDVLEVQPTSFSWDMSSVGESHSASDSETETLSTVDTSERAPMTDTEIRAEIEKPLTPQLPHIFQNKRPETAGEIQNNLETALKTQFSSERFERAMSTLEQYGQEEGLRRLRENDPEVAKQIEYFRNGVENSGQRNRKEVSQ